MNELEKIGLDGEFKHLDSTPPEGSKPRSVMTMEAVVESKPQELRSIRPYVDAIGKVPASIKPEAQIVLHALLSCFDRQKTVKEGLLEDIVWGFANGNIPPGCSVVGLQELKKLGYVKFQAPDNTFVDFNDSDKIDKAWIRYQPKLLELVYEDPSSK